MFDGQDVLKHSSLKCTLRGKCDETTTQFRNLKFADIPARFKDSILNDTLPIPLGSNGVFDATKFGPSCPQKHGAQKLDLALLGSTRITLAYEHGQGKTEATNEFECLHLNITVPNIVLKEGDTKPLPVLVWVHGGGFGIGSNSWPQYDLRRFVGRSTAIGKPVIGVSVNYRLGIFGVLASEELGAEGNMGYKDIVVTLRWVKKHIAGFGGDPGNVTAAGNSAGAITLSTILCANVGDSSLFERVLLMSGQVTIRRPTTSYWHQGICDDQYRYLGLAKESDSVKRSSLLHTDAQELAEKLPPIQHYCAHLDGEWLTEDLTTRVMVDGCRQEHKPA
jgi:carboxylesterase type B